MLIHCGTWATLQAIDTADITDGDTAYIYYNERSRLFQFNAAATNAEDNATHPYYLRPHDYGAAGVWVEQIGNTYDVINGDMIRTGAIESLNWVDGTSGMKIDLDNEYMVFKDATFGDDGIQFGWNAGAYKLNLQNGNVYFEFDGSHLTISVDPNVGTGVGVIYKDAKRWLYDFNPAHNGTVQPNGYNLFFGVEAGNLTIGSTATSPLESSHNIGIGYQTLYSLTKGYFNVAIGNQCLYDVTTGYDNIAIGSPAGFNLTTGAGNILIGYGTLSGGTTTGNNIAIGTNCLAGISVAADGIGSIAIGEGVLQYADTCDETVAIGYAAARFIANGSTELDITDHSVYLGSSTKSGAALITDAIDNEIVIGYNAIGNGSDTVTLGNTSIGEFHCQVALTVDSDERIKRNISSALAGLAFINALNPITFQMLNPADYPDDIKPSNFKDRIIKEKDPQTKKEIQKLIKADPRPAGNDKRYIGLVAQDVEQVMKDQNLDIDSLVVTSNRGKKAITYENLIMPLIRSIQELSQRVETLEAHA